MAKLLYLLLFITTVGFSQERKPLNGRVVNGTAGISNVFVINKTLGAEVTTNSTGNFIISAKAGDKIVVYSNTLEVREFAISEACFLDNPYVLSVNYKPYELEEVTVTASAITAESLNIVPKNQRKYTPAEKKLYTAGDFKWIDLLHILGGSMPFDPVLNAINGRTKRMKEGIATEKKETASDYIDGLYTEDEIINGLKVPKEHVQGFVYYAIENPAVAAATRADNQSLVRLLMIDLANKYVSLKQQE
ncbi:hypothetical protein [Flavobacterium subsaxonicum]|uniref:Uncharacterized protein n=1 Tax=Flavobacterium subsaxonicum WB 4.1-42 = DSM 21790 TaxID=1121898 RepID=A0A0A2MKJ7_9FLAO|nr:hypothetical protein [Flavobacterium subsaxonicum]KGO92101.1 hypothetical protein Q766_14510 [Flavobacterium subsaxonicum WB 4.1-42 = DSM 21790]